MIAHGLLLIDKPKGITSFDVIRELRRSTGVKKMGHTGTLDPMATGLLVICLGEATKLVPYLTADDKGYEAEVTFGVTTNTFDAEGDVVHVSPRDELMTLTEEQARTTLSSFLGAQQQRPPAFSAIKVDGERLYERARRGEEVEVPLRDVTFHTLELLSFSAGRESETEVTLDAPEEHSRDPRYGVDGMRSCPRARVDVLCSKGTYIRSLAADWGERLGFGAHLSGLRRTRAGHFSLSKAHQLDEVSSERLQELLIPLSEALPQAPIIRLNADEVTAIRHGKLIEWEPHLVPHSSVYRGLSPEGILVALLEPIEGQLKVLRGFQA